MISNDKIDEFLEDIEILTDDFILLMQDINKLKNNDSAESDYNLFLEGLIKKYVPDKANFVRKELDENIDFQKEMEIYHNENKSVHKLLELLEDMKFTISEDRINANFLYGFLSFTESENRYEHIETIYLILDKLDSYDVIINEKISDLKSDKKNLEPKFIKNIKEKNIELENEKIRYPKKPITNEETKQKQVLQLILEASSKEKIFNSNIIAQGKAIRLLLSERFEAKPISNDITERGVYNYEDDIFDTAIEKVQKTLKQLEYFKNCDTRKKLKKNMP